MSRREEAGVTFVCPACGGTIPLDDVTAAALLDAGCVFCGRELSPAAVRRRG